MGEDCPLHRPQEPAILLRNTLGGIARLRQGGRAEVHCRKRCRNGAARKHHRLRELCPQAVPRRQRLGSIPLHRRKQLPDARRHQVPDMRHLRRPARELPVQERPLRDHGRTGAEGRLGKPELLRLLPPETRRKRRRSQPPDSRHPSHRPDERGQGRQDRPLRLPHPRLLLHDALALLPEDRKPQHHRPARGHRDAHHRHCLHQPGQLQHRPRPDADAQHQHPESTGQHQRRTAPRPHPRIGMHRPCRLADCTGHHGGTHPPERAFVHGLHALAPHLLAICGGYGNDSPRRGHHRRTVSGMVYDLLPARTGAKGQLRPERQGKAAAHPAHRIPVRGVVRPHRVGGVYLPAKPLHAQPRIGLRPRPAARGKPARNALPEQPLP